MKKKRSSNKHYKINETENNFRLNNSIVYKWLINNIKAFFLGSLISFVVTVSATVILHSGQVRYKNDKSVEQEINELYQKADELYGYHIGDEIKVNGIDFYVMADSSAKQDYVVALKKTVLSISELGDYDATGNSGTAAFYYSDTCHQGATYGYNISDYSECSGHNNYENSTIKKFLDGTYINVLGASNLKEIDGYKIRLLNEQDLNGLGCVNIYSSMKTEGYNVPVWVYSNFSSDVGMAKYWTMIRHKSNIEGSIATVTTGGTLYTENPCGDRRSGHNVGIRPVINVYKSVITRLN